MRVSCLGLAATLAVGPLPVLRAMDTDALVLRRLHDLALTTSPAFEQLRELTTHYPGRLSGSRSLEQALVWAESILREMALDHVWTLETPVPHWERGARESARLLPPDGSDGEAVALSLLALGGSIATPPGGLTAEVVEVHSLAELAELGQERVAGRIVFFNRPMDPRHLDPGQAYVEAGDQRRLGPFEAARFGAVAALVRSLTLAQDDHPHTGATAYRDGPPTIPCAALGIQSANTLSAALAAVPGSRVELRIHSQWHPDATSYNVIGELRGREFPDRIIVVAGHLDSWDITPGAHDNGAGVVQAIEVLRLFQALNLRPRHTLRCVLFTNEENGLRGGRAYASHVRATGEHHVLALESDLGGFAPRGFALGSREGPVHERIARWRPELEPYGLHLFRAGPGGPDVAPLLPLGVAVGQLIVEPQRYFDYHHARTDTIDTVNPRELVLGAAALASLVYLVDTHGL
jgi:carboxypeptidase Q